MSLNAALLHSLSGLKTTQSQIDVVSRNIVNATTPGYTRKIRPQESRVVAGHNMGVDLGQLTRTVDAGVQLAMRQTASKVADYETIDAFQAKLETTLGKPGESTSLSGRLNALGNSFESLAANPDVPVNRSLVISAAENVVQSLHGIYAATETEMVHATAELNSAIDRVNETLEQIDHLNGMISSRTATQQETADLEDQRDVLLDQLAQEIDFKYFSREHGQIVIFTSDGKILLDDEVKTLSVTGAGVVEQTVDGVTRQLTFNSGRVHAFQDIRDNRIPDLRDQLDDIARAVTEELVAIDVELFNVGGATSYTPADLAGYAATIEVNDAIKAAPSLLLGTPPKEAGDNTVPLAAAALFARDDLTFSAAGLSTSNGITGAATEVIAGFANDRVQNGTQMSYYSTLKESLQRQFHNQSTVSLDEEMSTTIVLQTSYMAATRMVQTTQRLFDALFEMVR